MISTRQAAAIVVVAAFGVLGMTSAGLATANDGPPGQGPCNHGNSGKECKPDPQPDHGKDCDEHGPNEGGVNEDHCAVGTAETTGTTVDTTGPTETTPTETSTSVSPTVEATTTAIATTGTPTATPTDVTTLPPLPSVSTPPTRPRRETTIPAAQHGVLGSAATAKGKVHVLPFTP